MWFFFSSLSSNTSHWLYQSFWVILSCFAAVSSALLYFMDSNENLTVWIHWWFIDNFETRQNSQEKNNRKNIFRKTKIPSFCYSWKKHENGWIFLHFVCDTFFSILQTAIHQFIIDFWLHQEARNALYRFVHNWVDNLGFVYYRANGVLVKTREAMLSRMRKSILQFDICLPKKIYDMVRVLWKWW